MPLVGDATTTTTTAATMEVESNPSQFLAASTQEQALSNNEKDMIDSSSSLTVDDEFDESQCLFCNHSSSDLDQNMVHMSKAHGLYIDPTNLLVDVASLLAYFHLVISGYYECLYCGTQRNTRQAVQQHMIAKGHCKYDITSENAELRDFYESPASSEEDEQQQHLSRMRYSDDTQLPLRIRAKKSRASKQPERHASGTTTSSSDQALPTSTSVETLSPAQAQLSTRALKQEDVLNNQLAQLRADDRRSLLHLPASQQRALLATHHKQMEKAKRTEQTQRTNLESAGNKFGCLSKIKLIRKPPHTGNVASLKH